MNYQHILAACDLSDFGWRVAQHAHGLKEHYQATLSLLHVVETAPILESSFGPLLPLDIDLNEQMRLAATRRLDDWADRLGIQPEHRLIVMGSPKNEIIRLAREQSVDLIVMGSHGHHGVSLLLGSTANSVIHHAPCDVLAVRSQDSQ